MTVLVSRVSLVFNHILSSIFRHDHKESIFGIYLI